MSHRPGSVQIPLLSTKGRNFIASVNFRRSSGSQGVEGADASGSSPRALSPGTRWTRESGLEKMPAANSLSSWELPPSVAEVAICNRRLLETRQRNITRRKRSAISAARLPL